MSESVRIPDGTTRHWEGAQVVAVGTNPCPVVVLVGEDPDTQIQIAGLPFMATLGKTGIVEPPAPRIKLI